MPMDPLTVVPPPRRSAARYCSRCKTFHAAKNGESWIDRQPGGLWAPKHVYVCFLGVG